jgi:hypothetical protein
VNVEDLFADEPFDAARVTELDPWRTGDLVPGANWFWAGPAGPDPVTGTAGTPDTSPGEAWALYELGAEVGDYGVITSQTCDVPGTGPGKRHPTVQVSPVHSLDGYTPAEVREIRQGRRVSLVYLTGYPQSGEWAVDLSLSVPVSKGALLGVPRVSAFETGAEAVELCERVALKASRPALHDDLADVLVSGLNELLATAAASDWKYSIEQIRLIVLDGTRLDPKVVQLLVLTEGDPPSRRPLDGWRRNMAKKLRRRDAGITLSPNLWADIDRVKVKEYRTSAPLTLPELERPQYL